MTVLWLKETRKPPTNLPSMQHPNFILSRYLCNGKPTESNYTLIFYKPSKYPISKTLTNHNSTRLHHSHYSSNYDWPYHYLWHNQDSTIATHGTALFSILQCPITGKTIQNEFPFWLTSKTWWSSQVKHLGDRDQQHPRWSNVIKLSTTVNILSYNFQIHHIHNWHTIVAATSRIDHQQDKIWYMIHKHLHC